MTQTTKDGKVYTIPAKGKMLREKGTNRLYSRAVDYEGKVPEYEEVDDDSQNE